MWFGPIRAAEHGELPFMTGPMTQFFIYVTATIGI
jgi:hypothetical protein